MMNHLEVQQLAQVVANDPSALRALAAALLQHAKALEIIAGTPGDARGGMAERVTIERHGPSGILRRVHQGTGDAGVTCER